MPRLFVAIDFPETVNRRLASLAGGVRGARWLPPEQFHLTLRFIGEVDDGALADIAEALSLIRAAPFTLRLSGVGHFPLRGQPRVLWAGVEDNTALADLNALIESRLRRLGLAPERRNFAPHVTLARLKQVTLGRVRDFLADHADFITESVAIDEFQLYSSTLGARGAVHVIEASYGLDE
jgi:2'-5' RNA ligase